MPFVDRGKRTLSYRERMENEGASKTNNVIVGSHAMSSGKVPEDRSRQGIIKENLKQLEKDAKQAATQAKTKGEELQVLFSNFSPEVWEEMANNYQASMEAAEEAPSVIEEEDPSVNASKELFNYLKINAAALEKLREQMKDHATTMSLLANAQLGYDPLKVKPLTEREVAFRKAGLEKRQLVSERIFTELKNKIESDKQEQARLEQLAVMQLNPARSVPVNVLSHSTDQSSSQVAQSNSAPTEATKRKSSSNKMKEDAEEVSSEKKPKLDWEEDIFADLTPEEEDKKLEALLKYFIEKEDN